jgi:hypothetical protein
MASNRVRRPAPIFGELRPSQIITTFGPGAVVDLQYVSVPARSSIFNMSRWLSPGLTSG